MIKKVGLYAYGLVGKSPEKLDILGIDKKNRVYSVEGRSVCVCVSKIDTDKFQDEVKKLLSETESILRNHEDVVDALMKLTTIVPFKFGTVLRDEKAASKMLRDNEKKFKKLLSKFTGRVEWGLKVYADKPRQRPASQRGGRGSPGVAYLLGRKMEEESKNDVATGLVKVSEIIFHKAEKIAYEAKLNQTLPQKLTGKNKEMILNAAFLIEKEKVALFCQQVKRLTKKYEPMGLEIGLSGPWPPYSFT